MPLFRLSARILFPPASLAPKHGLLAVGGDLSLERLLLAYRMGIFPWFSEDDPILWWSPDPRLVLYPDELHVSRSLRKTMRQGVFQTTMDCAFEQVIRSCARIHTRNEQGTWITEEMIDAYCTLHRAGYAHSVEAWSGDMLSGGIYGVSLGKCFFGESMFSRTSNASKVALATLVEHLKRHDFAFLDCQVTTEHMLRMGAREIPRSRFLTQLEHEANQPTRKGLWTQP
jgi:leucyl/phenylalanyl-tRNA--protein transferase